MQEQVKNKYYEIMQKLESQPLPFSVELKDLSLSKRKNFDMNYVAKICG